MPYKLLIVDDSKLARMSVAKAMKALYPDWTRVEAANADEALALSGDAAFDVALLDFNMPGRDGLELAIELQNAHPKLPIAIISANHQDEIVARAAAIGAVFLPKPLTEAALSKFLLTALQQLESAKR
ncbi:MULTISPECIES: response regulator [Rhodopseudomonas]|uniref:Response regulator receiver protein n=1 Tax=Rhodopseudomonas palustris TaxID=1076 RepID=A0A0D7EVQ4_RHOPL|nr:MULTISPECIES: response regulator [Rhodopseudomonas]KIZ43527.1 response regulator receiver protein [Rhodopseudomonas palustris]MDF3809095.1 response regulator [Rhodopseudomonas sp. BAL398]WOK16414.1 response regulator [Rhodopseudomonas sp. BAL398]